jgi:hypothetical protein
LNVREALGRKIPLHGMPGQARRDWDWLIF